LRRFSHTALIFTLLSTAGYSQVRFFENGQATRTGPDAGLFPDTPTRTKIDLSGEWHYSTDGREWRTVTVPSAYDWTGKVTFRRTFDITPEMLDRFSFSVVAYGINYQSDMTINGNFVGRHTGGYSSFVQPIPQNTLQVGKENTIQISVDNELTPRTTLPLCQQVGAWRTYGGIFRDIYFLATPKLYVELAEAKTSFSAGQSSATVSVRAEITDRGSGIKPEANSFIGFQVEAFDKLSGNLTGQGGIVPFVPQPNKSVPVNGQVSIGTLKLWSPEVPDLYVLKCRIVRVMNKEVTLLDEYDFDIGVRELRWGDGKLYVNNTLTPLKGILWHEDHPSFGSAMTYDAMERDIAMVKSLGANLVRFLYPPHPYMLNLCDRYGLLVMEEIPLADVPAEILSKEYFQDEALNYIKEMVGRDKHHVSVTAWGIGDEFEQTSSSACDYVNNARNAIKSVDDRYVYFATNNLHDRCFEYVDLVVLNTYSDNAKEFREFLKQSQSRYPDKPIVVGRYGRNIEPDNRNGYSDPNSMEAQARTVMQFYEAMKDSKVAGSVLWSFSDWRSDRPALTTHANDPYLQSIGILSYEREKRPAFEVTRALFNGEKLQALPVGNYAPSAPISYVLAGLVVLLSFAFLYNSNRRFRECVNRSLFRTYNFFADVRDQRVIATTHSLFLAVVISVTWAIILSSIFSHYRENILWDNMLSQFMGDNLKAWFVQLVWHPTTFILVISGLVLLKILVLIALVKLLAMIVRTHVYTYHAVSITIWSMLPYVILIPLTMILYRIMESEMYVLPVAVLLILMNAWVFMRLLKGVSIIYDVFPLKVYAVGILLVLVCTASVYGYFDYTRSTSVYLRYFFQSVHASM